MSDRDRLWQERAIEDGVTEQIEYETLAARIQGYGEDFVEVSGLKRHIKQQDTDYDAELRRLESLRERDANIDRTVNRGASRNYGLLRNMGYDHDTSMEMTANAEHEVQDDHSEGDPLLGAPIRELMKGPEGNSPPARVQPTGKAVHCRTKDCDGVFEADAISCPKCGREVKPFRFSGGNRKVVGHCTNCKASIVSGIVVCQECGTEYKEHWKKKGEELRSNIVTARIADEAKSAIQESEATYGDILNAIGEMMFKTGLPWQAIAVQLGILSSEDAA